MGWVVELVCRDLLKLCQRLVLRGFSLEGTQAAEHTFQDTMDCLCQSIRDLAKRQALAQQCGALLGLTKSQVCTCTTNVERADFSL